MGIICQIIYTCGYWINHKGMDSSTGGGLGMTTEDKITRDEGKACECGFPIKSGMTGMGVWTRVGMV